METLTETVTFGRRKEDTALINEMLSRLSKSFKPVLAPIVSNEKKTRRPRRTKAILKQALLEASNNVATAYPEWTPKRVMRRARSLVRLYKTA